MFYRSFWEDFDGRQFLELPFQPFNDGIHSKAIIFVFVTVKAEVVSRSFLLCSHPHTVDFFHFQLFLQVTLSKVSYFFVKVYSELPRSKIHEIELELFIILICGRRSSKIFKLQKGFQDKTIVLLVYHP